LVLATQNFGGITGRGTSPLRIVRRKLARKDIFSRDGGVGSVAGMSKELLLAEPEPATRGFLERHLRQDGFDVVEALDGEAVELLEVTRPDLVLAADSLAADLCRAADVPIIVLGRPDSDPVDRVRAFDSGCDDYVARPFHYEELLARIRAVLRRVSPPASDRIVVGDLLIDLAARRVTIRGTPVILAAKEYELLVKLAEEPGRVFTKEQLLREVWDFRSLGRTRTLDSHASRLGGKLAPPGGDFVRNVWGVGYSLVDD
jgi:DNA-binding response OmpR family regulator